MSVSKKSSTSDLPLQTKEVTDIEVANFKLSPHLIRLMWDEPFFSRILRGINKIRTEQIPTAGVLAKDGEINFWWNPRFLAGLNPQQIKGLIKHECYHLLFDHTTTRRQDPHIIWNYATDLAINSLIDENELPEGGLIPGKSFEPLTEEQMATMGPKAVENYMMVSQKISAFPKNQSSEWYFSQLMSDEDVKKAIENSQSAQSLADALANGDVMFDENGNLVDKDGNPVSVLPGSMDDHDGWDDLNDEQRELIKGQIKQSLKDAVKDCDAKGSWGSVGSEMQRTLRKMTVSEIPWQSVLKQFCGFTRRADRSGNVRRLNRKYPGIHPGIQRNYKANIAVYLDQSGSVSDSDLELLAGELEGLAKRVEFTLFNFDTSVDEKSERVLRKGRAVSLERTRCGGTCFTCVQEHAEANAHRFDGYLVLTDGYASNPGITRMKRGWVIVPTGKLAFSKSKKDFLIQMKQ